MSQPEVNCPRCESPQDFVVHVRQTQHRWQEEVVKCGMCRYEQVLRLTTTEITELRKLLLSYEKRKQGRINAGKPVLTFLLRGQARTRTRLSLLLSELQEEVRRGQSAHSDSA